MESTTFYGWWQLCFCAFAFFGLMAVYWHIGRRQGDHGQVWLALSVLCWSVSGGAEIIFVQQEVSPVTQDGWRSILSLLNSGCILMALPGFRYIPKRLEAIVQSNYWGIMVGLPLLFSLLPTLSAMLSQETTRFVSELDVYYATLTLIFLGSVLWTSFMYRRLSTLAYLSILCILITFSAQMLKLTPLQLNENLISAIFKSCLIMLFFALALSWVKELMENVLPEAKHIFLKLKNDITDGKVNHQVAISGIGQPGTHHISLTASHFELLRKFMSAKQEGEEWLEIRPKNETRSGKIYPIKDHNEIKRLLTALLDGIFGKGAWTQKHHYLPLRETCFEVSEKRDRKIRLRMPKENLEMEL